MRRMNSAVPIVLIALILFQSWQIVQLRRQVQAILQTQDHPAAVSDSVTKRETAAQHLQKALNALQSGKIEQAQKAARIGVAELERYARKPQSITIQKGLQATREHLEKQLHFIYQPAKDGKK